MTNKAEQFIQKCRELENLEHMSFKIFELRRTLTAEIVDTSDNPGVEEGNIVKIALEHEHGRNYSYFHPEDIKKLAHWLLDILETKDEA